MLVVLVYLGLLALNIWIFLVRAHGNWPEKAGILLQVLTLYTFAFGFLSKTDLLKDFGNITEEMTSPNLYEFLRGNFAFLTILFSSIKVALTPEKTGYSWFYLLEMPLVMVCGLAVFVYAVFHLVVIVPIAYLAYVIVSVPIRSIQASADDVAISIGDKTVTKTVSIKDIISSNVVPLRNFLIGIPAIALSMILRIPSIFA